MINGDPDPGVPLMDDDEFEAKRSSASPRSSSSLWSYDSDLDYDDPYEKQLDKIPFPPLFFWPGIVPFLSAIIVITGIVLSVTVYSDEVKQWTGLSRDTIIAYGSIPFVSLVFTYVHIWLALWMTFYPIKFVGILRIPGTNVGVPGWQGIIPHKAIKMATTATRLMTEKLISIRDVFNRIDPEEISVRLLPVLQQLMREVTHTCAEEVMPDIWEMFPASVKEEMVNKALDDVPRIVRNMFEEMQENLEQVFDLEHMVISTLSHDKELLNNVFIRCGNDELAFIRNAGAYMGFLFGVIQMVVWIFYARGWMLPVVGLVVGSFTNWMALSIIFKPVEPVNLGCYTLQGLFLKRQAAVSAEYGRTVAARVLTARNIIRTLITGPTTDRLFLILNKHMQAACDDYAGVSARFLRFTAGERYQIAKNRIVGRLLQELPHVLSHVEDYSDEVLDMENLLRTKLAALPPAEFEGMLHPVFEEDEWKLVLMGGVLGFAIGVAQAYFLGS